MIELKNVSYAYPSAENANPDPSLIDVSFSLDKGELVAVVGANGAGKSTLGCLLCGTFEPRSGKIVSDGAEFKQEALEEADSDGIALDSEVLHRLVGYVRQDPTSQLVAPTVFDEVAFGPCNLGLPEQTVLENIDWALDAVGLSSYKDRLVSELSGGELQRLSIAGVLAMKPKYMVLDEVTSQLDYFSRIELRHIIEELAHSGVGILMIVHDALEVAQATRVVLVENGTIGWQGTPKQFFADSSLVSRACLRIPQKPSFAKQFSKQIPTPELLVNDVSVAYDEVFALKNLSTTASKGQILLVAGRSGSGKSTLASVCAGLIEPEQGSVLLDGVPVKVGKVALCMQRPETQLFCDSVVQDVAFGPSNMGLSEQEATARAQETLQALGISEKLWDASPFALSGGQRRRVALAGIVALDTNVVVLDEPTVGLDVQGQDQLLSVIKKLADEGRAIIVVSHDIDLWLDTADQILLLDEGELAWEGSAQELSAQPQALNKIGIKDLAWQQMESELKRLGCEMPEVEAAPSTDTPSEAQAAPNADAPAGGDE